MALAPDRARLLSQLLDAGCDVLPLRTSAVTLQVSLRLSLSLSLTLAST